MENLKLVSVRLNPKTLDKLDDIAARHNYYTRSSIINRLLNAVLFCSSDEILWRLISTYSPETCGYTVDFHVDREKLANLPYD